MEDSGEEDNRPMCCQSEAGGHCFDWRRTGLLWDGPGMLADILLSCIVTWMFICCLNVCISIKISLSLQSGQLNEYTERKEMSADVVCMSLANVPPGEQRSRFLAVGLVDNTVRIISLDPSVSYNLLFFNWSADLDSKTRILVTVPTELVWNVLSLCCTGLSTAVEYAGSSRPARVSLYCGDGWSGKTGWAGRKGHHWLSIPQHWPAG